MGKLQLRALFLSGTSLGFSAQDIFTDRLSESEAFERARTTVTDHRSLAFSELYRQPRRNVLCYYGAGGIGKTTLSRKLERDAHELSAKRSERKLSTIRFDLADALDREPETFILGMRAAIGRICPRLTAFDLAFGSYWERAHPGYPLHDFLSNHGALGQVAGELNLADNIQATIVEALGFLGPIGGLIGASTEGARWVFRRVRQARSEHQLLSDCPYFGQLVDADPDEDTLSYFASLLAWDLGNNADRTNLEIIAFVDSFEELTQSTGRHKEQLLQRICYLLPNVLFVVTGRNRLDWADLVPPAELDYVGRAHWPTLQADNQEHEPRQHLLGYLSEHDCREFLRSVFADAGHRIPAEIEDAIVVGSSGLPLYLDLEIAYYLELLAAGTEPSASMFGGPLSAVVTRSMQDMAPDERRLLRAASLLRFFDHDLLRDTAQDVTDAAVERFLSRPFIERAKGTVWPYTMHSTLRDTVRLVDHELPDGWSEREWRLAAGRAMTELGAIIAGLGGRPKLEIVAGAFATGMNLCSLYSLSADWLITAAKLLADAGYWGNLDLPSTDANETSSAGATLAAGFRGIALRRRGRLSDSIRELDRCLSGSELSDGARRYFTLHRANSLRNSGAYDRAELEYRSLAPHNDEAARSARYQLADIALLRGQFERCIAAIDQEPEPDPYLSTEFLRLRGHAARFSGIFGEAETSYREAFDLARSIGSLSAEGKAITNLAECACWTSPSAGRQQATASIEFNRSIGNRLEVIKGLVALAVSSVEEGSDAVDGPLVEASELAHEVGYRAGVLFCDWGRAFHAFCLDDPDLLRQALRAMEDTASQINTYRFLVNIGQLWLSDLEERDHLLHSDVEWLRGPEASVEAWLQVKRVGQ